ncbi:MAG: hypothetical protein L0154_06540 [Chloroflexi bacterium]|nr:hypothetical protein [Chloroflexota bacterium]
MPDNETVILEPKPPQQIPEDFNPAYWQRRRLPLVVIGCGTLLVLVACAAIAGAAYLTFTSEDDPEEAVEATASGEPSATIFVVGSNLSPTSSQSPGPTISPTETNLQFLTNTPDSSDPTSTFTFVPPSRIPATSTPNLTHTIAFTNTPTSTNTVTQTPTPTNTSNVPTNTIPPTLVPPTIIPSSPPTNTRPAPPSFTPQPTIPDGRLVRLFYDRNSFYAHNASPDDIPVSLFRFEAVDATGADAGYSLSGTRWSEFYRYIEDGNCAAIEITRSSPWLRPLQCHFYNAILTPQRSNSGNFWLAREGIAEFRVLYDEVEIGRCPVGSGTCDVYVP